jgi:hypothetical protein
MKARSAQDHVKSLLQFARRILRVTGLEVRVDRRSVADQGIDREPQIHVGAGAQRLGRAPP